VWAETGYHEKIRMLMARGLIREKAAQREK
jgi:hypothetical protein